MNIRQPAETMFAGSSLERRIADLTVLYEVSRALQTTLEEKKTLYTLLTGVTHGRGLGFNRAFILLVNSRTELLEGRMAVGPSSPEEAGRIWQEQRRKRQGLGQILEQPPPPTGNDLRVNEIVDRLRIPLAEKDNLLVRIMRAHEVCHADGVSFQPHGWPVEPWLPELLGTRAFAAAPLYLAGRDLGLIIADNAITQAPIAAANLQLLQIYSQVASASIQNTHLYRELTERIESCEQANHRLLESQNQLLQAERLSTIGKMAALLAHEVRTPLVSIGGFARRLLRRTPADDPRKEEMEIIISEVSRLERLVEEVLGFSRISKPEYESTDMNSLIQSVIVTMENLIEKNSVRTALRLDPQLPAARVDKFQIRQALLNLIDNALDAMTGGGVLTVATSCQDNFLEIEISDTGVGIAQEHWSKLFVPFFTTKTSGTGLGLAVVSQIIENHMGSLRFDSIAGQGTSFYIRLSPDPERGLSERNCAPVVKK